jgi:hypothetical protein
VNAPDWIIRWYCSTENRAIGKGGTATATPIIYHYSYETGFSPEIGGCRRRAALGTGVEPAAIAWVRQEAGAGLDGTLLRMA